MPRPWMMAAALLPSLVVTAAEPLRVLVLKSADRAAYTSVMAGFAAELHGAVTEVVLEESSEAAAKTLDRIAANPPALVLAVGPGAAASAHRRLSNLPVIFCMVPYYERYGLDGPNITGIAMSGDLAIQLATLKAVSASMVRVGILHDPRYSTGLIEDARRLAKEKGITVVPLEVDSEASAAKILAGAHGRVDAMLMVADKTVATATVVRKLISFCEESKLPLLGLSASQVKEGAMLSLSANPSAIGQQAGRIANRILVEKVNPGALAVAQPEGLELAMNLTTARKLGATCDLSLEIFKFAARQSFPIKVFE